MNFIAKTIIYISFTLCFSGILKANEELIKSLIERAALSKEGQVSYTVETWQLTEPDITLLNPILSEDLDFNKEVGKLNLAERKSSIVKVEILFNKSGYKVIEDQSVVDVPAKIIEKYSYKKNTARLIYGNILGTQINYDEISNKAKIAAEQPLRFPAPGLLDLDPTIYNFDKILEKIPGRSVEFIEQKDIFKFKSKYKKEGATVASFKNGTLTGVISQFFGDKGQTISKMAQYYTGHKKIEGSPLFVPASVWTVQYSLDKNGQNNNRPLIKKFTVNSWELKAIPDEQLSIEIPEDAEIN